MKQELLELYKSLLFNVPLTTPTLKTYAIARILLDNIPNIKVYWATSTINLALIAQEFGANDLDGTI